MAKIKVRLKGDTSVGSKFYKAHSVVELDESNAHPLLIAGSAVLADAPRIADRPVEAKERKADA